MLRTCILDWKGSWKDHLHLVEFSYNSKDQASMKMVPFEALYGKQCWSLVCWGKVGERRHLVPDMIILTMDNIRKIREHYVQLRTNRKYRQI